MSEKHKKYRKKVQETRKYVRDYNILNEQDFYLPERKEIWSSLDRVSPAKLKQIIDWQQEYNSVIVAMQELRDECDNQEELEEVERKIFKIFGDYAELRKILKKQKKEAARARNNG